MQLYPNAKINLGLNIIRKRSDGYHDIETVMYPIPLTDQLEITKSDTLSFDIDGIPLADDGKENLVVRAWRLVNERHNIGAVRIHLIKNIPSGAGLGGGSADAAFTIRGLNELFQIGMSVSEMETIASKLGADCAFFIKNQPALCCGIGNILKPIELSLAGWQLLLVKPDVSVSTPEAYHGCTPAAWTTPIAEMINLPVAEWRNLLKNDFEQQVFAKYPTLGKLKTSLYDNGATYSAMSGSGSSIYGLYHNSQDINLLTPYTIFKLTL